MEKTVKIRNLSSTCGDVRVKVCNTFFTRFLGLMFSKALNQDCGIIIEEKQESRLNTSIHMFFMNYDITVVWLDEQRVVVDKALAKKWAPMYYPKKPAKYVLELHSSKYSDYSLGDQLVEVKEDFSTGS